MRRICLAKMAALLTCSVLTLAIVPLVGAQGEDERPDRDPAFEREIYQRLTGINPEAVPIFQEATRAMDADEWDAARRGYERVLELAPGFPDAARRLSYVHLAMNAPEPALQYAQQAFDADPSPHNHSALAWALLSTEEPDKLARGLTLAQAAVNAMPDEPDFQYVLLVAGIGNEDLDTMRQASAALVRLEPGFADGHYFAGLVAVEDGKWIEAERELLLAQELGMAPELVQSALDTGIKSQARRRRWLRAGGYILIACLAGFVLLSLAGRWTRRFRQP